MAKKKKKATSTTSSGLWFEKDFEEGSGSDPIGKKRKLIEAFYRGYIHSYNENGGTPNGKTFEILTTGGFKWTVNKGQQHVEVYITPPPIPPPPGGAGRSDPPDPTQPPPDMP